jgi:AcrR family transcriptional regulator
MSEEHPPGDLRGEPRPGTKPGPVAAGTARYARKQKAIIAAASEILNCDGVKGMTLASVASRVGLITTSVTYYFKRKEDLAVACFFDGIARCEELIDDALRAADPHARLLRLLESWIDLRRRIAAGQAATIPFFNDIRALQEPQRELVIEAYMRFFAKVRKLFAARELALGEDAITARAHIVTEQLFWAVAWLPRYDLEDYDRVRDRMYDILVNGLSVATSRWEPRQLDLDHVLQPATQELTAQETFLIAATRLINEQGYRGASVEKISARLNVTKGSFYHHHEAKDDLVIECFRRSFEVMRRIQRAVCDEQRDHWSKLATAAATLVEYQLSHRGPLLRTSALTALPASMRNQMIEASNRVSDRFASMISDGIALQSVRAVDPHIAAQMLTATLNASAEIKWWIPEVERGAAAALYAKPMLMGLFKSG